VFKKHNITVT